MAAGHGPSPLDSGQLCIKCGCATFAPGSMAACAEFCLPVLWMWDVMREGIEALFQRLSLADYGT